MIEIYTKRVMEWLDKYGYVLLNNITERDLINYGFKDNQSAEECAMYVRKYGCVRTAA